MDKTQIRETIARRAALELKDGDVVNLGIGLPTMIPSFLPEGVHVMLQSENGMIGMGPAPEEGKEEAIWTNAGGGYITAVPGAATFDSATPFALIRGGKMAPGMGGAMDLLDGTKKVILAMEHTAKGRAKILKKCRLPLTAKGQVNLIITEMCVMEVSKGKGLVVTELNPAFTKDDVIANTEATLTFAEDLKPMRQ